MVFYDESSAEWRIYIVSANRHNFEVNVINLQLTKMINDLSVLSTKTKKENE